MISLILVFYFSSSSFCLRYLASRAIISCSCLVLSALIFTGSSQIEMISTFSFSSWISFWFNFYFCLRAEISLFLSVKVFTNSRLFFKVSSWFISNSLYSSTCLLYFDSYCLYPLFRSIRSLSFLWSYFLYFYFSFLLLFYSSLRSSSNY